jgi:hypothetical protein
MMSNKCSDLEVCHSETCARSPGKVNLRLLGNVTLFSLETKIRCSANHVRKILISVHNSEPREFRVLPTSERSLVDYLLNVAHFQKRIPRTQLLTQQRRQPQGWELGIWVRGEIPHQGIGTQLGPAMTGAGARSPLHISPEKGRRRPGRGGGGKYMNHTHEIGAGKAATGQ